MLSKTRLGNQDTTAEGGNLNHFYDSYGTYLANCGFSSGVKKLW